MHKLLERQLGKCYGSLEKVPADLRPLIDLVDKAYTAADQDRALLERSMELASKEMIEKQEALEEQIKKERDAREALRESEENYRRIVETSSEGIWLVGPDQNTTFVNQRMADMLGYEVEELVGRPVLDFIVGDRKPDAQHAFEERTLRLDGQRDVELRRKDGSRMWAIVSSKAIKGPDGEYHGTLGMITDIDARKRAEQGIKEAYERLQELERFRSQFINLAAHELSTPLTPLRLQLHMMRKQLDQAGETSKHLDIVERSVDRLSLLVDDLLDSAKLQTDAMRFSQVDTDLADLVESAVDSFQEFAGQRGVTLKFEREGDLPVRCDQERIAQVVDNLLSNALKFTPEGGTVKVSVGLYDDHPSVCVKDDGLGISKEGLERLFQPFSQIHEPDSSRPHGTGLGLYICKRIIDSSSGKIWAESDGEGEGATFRFVLPERKK